MSRECHIVSNAYKYLYYVNVDMQNNNKKHEERPEGSDELQDESMTLTTVTD